MKHLSTLILLLLCLGLNGQQPTGFMYSIKAIGHGNCWSNLSGIHAVYSNPAGISSPGKIQFNLGARNQFEITELTSFQVGMIGNIDRFGSIGFSIIQFGMAEFVDQKIALTYARHLSEKLKLGIKFDYLHTRILEYGHINNFTFELGMQGKLSERIEFAFHVFNPIGKKYSADRILPTIVALGAVYKVSEELKLCIELEKNNYNPLQFKTGIEYHIFENLSLSTGIFTSSGNANMTAGMCLEIKKKLKLDLVVGFHQLLGITSGISFDYSI